MAAASGTGGETRGNAFWVYGISIFSHPEKKKKNYISSFIAVVTIALSCNHPNWMPRATNYFIIVKKTIFFSFFFFTTHSANTPTSSLKDGTTLYIITGINIIIRVFEMDIALISKFLCYHNPFKTNTFFFCLVVKSL